MSMGTRTGTCKEERVGRRRQKPGDCPYCVSPVTVLADHIALEHPAHATREIHAVPEPIPMRSKVAKGHLYALYGRHCMACGRKPPEVKLTVDHVVPLARGGEDSLDNYQLLCDPCNQMKAAEVIDFRRTGEPVSDTLPVEPSADGSVPEHAQDEPESCWLTFTDIEPPEHSGTPVAAEVLRLSDGTTVVQLGPVDLYDNNVSFKAKRDGTIRMKFDCRIALSLNENATELVALPGPASLSKAS